MDQSVGWGKKRYQVAWDGSNHWSQRGASLIRCTLSRRERQLRLRGMVFSGRGKSNAKTVLYAWSICTTARRPLVVVVERVEVRIVGGEVREVAKARSHRAFWLWSWLWILLQWHGKPLEDFEQLRGMIDLGITQLLWLPYAEQATVGGQGWKLGDQTRSYSNSLG